MKAIETRALANHVAISIPAGPRRRLMRGLQATTGLDYSETIEERLDSLTQHALDLSSGSDFENTVTLSTIAALALSALYQLTTPEGARCESCLATANGAPMPYCSTCLHKRLSSAIRLETTNDEG